MQPLTMKVQYYIRDFMLYDLFGYICTIFIKILQLHVC